MDPQSDDDRLDFVIIDSGYTALLIPNFGFNRCETIVMDFLVPKNGESRLSHAQPNKYGEIRSRNELSDIEDIDLVEFMESCLFIYDGIWGNGLYRIGNDDDIDNLLHIIERIGASTLGIICFKCKNRLDIMKRIGILQKFGFARLHHYIGNEYVNTDGITVTVAKFRN